MGDLLTEEVTELPVRSQHVVVHADTRSVHLRVFCPAQERSVAYAECSRCPRLRSLPASPQEAGACIACVPAARPIGAEPALGAVVGPHLLCVRPDLPLTQLSDVFAEVATPQLAVVGAEGRLLGTVWRHDFVRRLPTSFTRPKLAADRMERAAHLHERARVSDAVAAFTRDGARVLFVVDDDLAVVGALTDLDLLRWWAAERRRCAL